MVCQICGQLAFVKESQIVKWLTPSIANLNDTPIAHLNGTPVFKKGLVNLMEYIKKCDDARLQEFVAAIRSCGSALFEDRSVTMNSRDIVSPGMSPSHLIQYVDSALSTDVTRPAYDIVELFVHAGATVLPFLTKTLQSYSGESPVIGGDSRVASWVARMIEDAIRGIEKLGDQKSN